LHPVKTTNVKHGKTVLFYSSTVGLNTVFSTVIWLTIFREHNVFRLFENYCKESVMHNG